MLPGGDVCPMVLKAKTLNPGVYVTFGNWRYQTLEPDGGYSGGSLLEAGRCWKYQKTSKNKRVFGWHATCRDVQMDSETDAAWREGFHRSTMLSSAVKDSFVCGG